MAWLIFGPLLVIMALLTLFAAPTSESPLSKIPKHPDQISRAFPQPHDFLVGNIRLRVPAWQMTDFVPDGEFFDRNPPRMDVVRSITFIGKDAWAIGGIPRTAPDWPPTMLLIELSDRADAVSLDAWCSSTSALDWKAGRDISVSDGAPVGQGFYILGEQRFRGAGGIRIPINNIKLFNSPLAFDTAGIIDDPDQSSSSPNRLYSLEMSLSSNVALYIRFNGGDLDRMPVDRLIANIQMTITNWASTTPDFQAQLYHQPSKACPSR